MTGPWAALPRQFAVELRKERQTLAVEIVREIRKHVPEFSRPLDGKFGAGIRHGVETALAEFADLVEGTRQRSAEERSAVYRALGRGEFAEGRGLDALQSAYRLGARVAWRRYARAARRSGMGPELLVTLAEAVFVHIDGIASASVQGYAEARAAETGALGRLRRRLLDLVLAGAPQEQVEKAAAEAEWPLPEQVACVALGPAGERGGRGRGGHGRGRRMPGVVLSGPDDPEPFLLVPQPAELLRDDQVRALMLERGAVIGPTVPLDLAADSLRWARAAAAAGAAGAGGPGAGPGLGPGAGPEPRPWPGPVSGSGPGPESRPETGPGTGPGPWPGPGVGVEPVSCDSRLPDLLLLADPALVRLMAERRLAPLAGLTPRQSERLAATLLAWLQTDRGSAPEVAARLGIHPQTARQRLHRVQELFGAALSDPDARFELEVALRGRPARPSAAPSAPPSGRTS